MMIFLKDDDVKKLDKKMEKTSIEFLIDENILGIDRHLASLDIKYRKVGDPECPKLGSDDPTVAKFAQKNNLVIITNDDKLQKKVVIIRHVPPPPPCHHRNFSEHVCHHWACTPSILCHHDIIYGHPLSSISTIFKYLH